MHPIPISKDRSLRHCYPTQQVSSLKNFHLVAAVEPCLLSIRDGVGYTSSSSSGFCSASKATLRCIWVATSEPSTALRISPTPMIFSLLQSSCRISIWFLKGLNFRNSQEKNLISGQGQGSPQLLCMFALVMLHIWCFRTFCWYYVGLAGHLAQMFGSEHLEHS